MHSDLQKLVIWAEVTILVREENGQGRSSHKESGWSRIRLKILQRNYINLPRLTFHLKEGRIGRMLICFHDPMSL